MEAMVRIGCRSWATVLLVSAASVLAAPFAYVPDSNSNVTVIDLATRTVVTTIPIEPSAGRIAVSPQGDRVYVLHVGGIVSVIDATTNAVFTTIAGTLPAGGSPSGLAVGPDGNRIYVMSESFFGTWYAYDPKTGAQVASYGTVRYPHDLAINGAGTKAYTFRAGPSWSQVYEEDLVTRASRFVSIPGGNFGLTNLAVNAAGTRLYVTSQTSGVTVVDAGSMGIITHIPVFGTRLATNPAGTRVYVAQANGVSVIDATSNTYLATIPVSTPAGIDADPSGDFVYIVEAGTNRLLVVNAATNAIVTGIPVGPGASAIGKFVGPATITSAPGTGTNWALASNGATAWASSVYGDGFPASGAIDGDRRGSVWAGGTAWNDGTPMQFPDVLQVLFNGMKSIDRIDLYTAQDDALNPVEPTSVMTFAQHGIQDFTLEGWTGTNWVLLARVTGNDRVKRTFVFPPVTIDRVYLNVTRTADGYTYVAELEAWQTNPGTNVALASQGGVAWASSEYGAGFPASAVIDGDRAGRNWGAGSGWNDATYNSWPDWIQVAFGGLKTIDRVVVYTLQDNATNPSEPSDTMQFTRYGVIEFQIEGWTGTQWIPLGRPVSGNRNVKRAVTFDPVAVDRVFIWVTRSADPYSHITEVEAWAP